jgi:hypothetical protein
MRGSRTAVNTGAMAVRMNGDRWSRVAGGLATWLVLAGVAMLACSGAAVAEPSTRPFEIEPGSFRVTPSTFQAGAHEDLTMQFNFAHDAEGRTYNDVDDTVVDLPAGFTASNTAVPTCSMAQLLGATGKGAECPPESQVGVIHFDLTLGAGPVYSTFPVYNMEVTSTGIAAELGFNATILAQVLPVNVREGDTGLTGASRDIEGLAEPHQVSLTLWGVPAASTHDAERGLVCYERGVVGVASCEGSGGETVDIQQRPFLSNPTSCGLFTAGLKADAWEEPQAESWLYGPVEAGRLSALGEVGPIVECERVPFHPSIEVQPTTRSAESATGLNVSLVVPQSWESAETIATANLKDTTVVLPEGMTINPSAGSGLGSCSPAQYAEESAESPVGVGCPSESKIGSIEIETPVLAEKIPGAIYIATPYDNPFSEPGHPDGSLLALYVVAKDPARGIIVKVAGKVELNPVTGQLTTVFLNTPQQPFSRFTLKFRPGATAPLVSPPACGTYAAQAALTPWSAPLEPRMVSSTPFEVTQGVREGPCPAGGVPPFDPQVISGTQNNDAGSYSPFYLRILRQDGEQEITRFTTVLPPGLSGNISGIPFCPEADIEAARHKTGAEEEANPSCPAASEIGHTIVSAGVGTVLAQTPGRVYLAGPYHGSALSIVSVTSAKVGPFDLGTVVIRFALNINPSTAQVEVSANRSDPIPHIIDGVVVHVREIRVYMNREKFILNPTNCDPMSIAEAIDGAGADPANPADQVPVSASAPFQAADCSSLAFKPAFKASALGKWTRLNGTSLSVKLEVPGALGTQANIARVKVELPKQLPSRLPTLRKACLASVFETNPAACPPESIIGHAKATTPIVPVPLEGPAYFVSHGGEAWPSLIIVLQGYGITVDLTGTTLISKQGVTSSTFKAVPDVPVGTFELTLPAGPYSALTGLGNLCKSKLAMPTEFVAQNGMVLDQKTKVTATGCPRAKKAHKPAAHKTKRGKGAHGKGKRTNRKG